MCGINGFFSLSHKFPESNLREMASALNHRGPDAEGFFFDGICGLGHKRLSIIDLSQKANQPMFSADERFVIVYNGEIYNFRELSRQLEKPLKTTSDTEVILELFAKINIRMVYQLNGMFALAIYDRLEKELYLFRDRIGIKPLYYFWDEHSFAFASELKALVQLPQIPKEINQAAISDFLHLGYIPAPASIYKNIYKMPSGTWIKINKEGLVSGQYWSLRDKIYAKDVQSKLGNLNKESEAKQQLKKILLSSVKGQLISDVPLGVFLSGGIDSSTVAALAVDAAESPIHTFSIGFKENKFNEAEYAKAVANHLKTQHTEFIVSSDEAKQLIPELMKVYDEPFADSSAIPTMLLSKLAREQVKVVLGGDGGDELFLGYGMYRWAERLAKPVWHNFRKPISKSLKLLKNNKYQKAGALFGYKKKQELASHIFSQEQHLFSKKEISALSINNFTLKNYHSNSFNRELSAMEVQAIFDMEYYLQDDLLVKIDRASMRYSLETRVPLLDHRLIEFALNLSADLKYKNGESKYLLKQVLYDYLPEKLFDRPKQGFAIPLIDWLKTDLNYLIEENLNEKTIKHFGIVKYEQVELIKKKFLKGNSYYYNRLWALIILHQFLQKNT